MLEQASAPLAPLTTLRVGGPARRMVTATTEQEIVETVKDCDRRGEPLLVLAGGSNLLIGDDGFDGTVLKIASTGVTKQKTCSGLRLGVAAGTTGRLRRRSGGPRRGRRRGAERHPRLGPRHPIQNVGAYGQDVGQSIAWIRALDRETGDIRGMQSRCLEFGYRDSVFKQNPGKYVVLTGPVRLRPAGGVRSRPPVRADPLRRTGRALSASKEGERVPLAQVRETVLKLRAAKGMVLNAQDHDTWSAGSFFTNPVLDLEAFDALAARSAAAPPRFPAPNNQVKTSAAWLIEQAGYPKGYGAGPGDPVHEAHAGADQPGRRRGRGRTGAGARDPGRSAGPVRAGCTSWCSWALICSRRWGRRTPIAELRVTDLLVLICRC